MMSIVALDLATYTVGYALSSDGWYCASKSLGTTSHSLVKRLGVLSEWLDYIVGAAQWDILAIETPDLAWKSMQKGNMSIASLKALYTALGVCYDVARRHGMAILEVDPRIVKERFTGNEVATKADVQWALKQRRYLTPMKEDGTIDFDASDALALGVVVQDQIAQLRSVPNLSINMLRDAMKR